MRIAILLLFSGAISAALFIFRVVVGAPIPWWGILFPVFLVYAWIAILVVADAMGYIWKDEDEGD